MNKIVEIIAMALGGLSLFAVCLMGFTAMSGEPLSKTPGIGNFLGGSEEDAEGSSASGSPRASGAAPQDEARTPTELVETSVGMMSAWSLPSPYNAGELNDLVAELKSQRTLIGVRERELDDIEARLEEDRIVLQERFDTLESMQASLEAYERELELREAEVLRGEDSVRHESNRRWSEVADVLTSLDTSVAGERLAEYEPEEAAHILRAMSPEKATEIVNVVPQRWKDYVEAYTRLVPADERP